MSDTTTERKPRYQDLADQLRAQILAKAIAPDAFPTESALCARFGVSRFTVREALRQLQGEGLIQRRRGSGTAIKPGRGRNRTARPLSNVSEILQYARDTQVQFERLSPAPLPRALAEQIGEETPGKWARYRGVRAGADGAPIAVTDAYIHPDLAHHAAEVNPFEPTIFRQLERLAGVRVASVTQDIEAVPASAAMAQALDVPRRSPCLRILRCYVDADERIVEISDSYHPSDRFAYRMHTEVES